MAQKTQRVRVLRAFYERNKLVGVGTVKDMPFSLAAELRAANKVEFVQADTAKKESAKIKDDDTDGVKGSGKAAADKGSK